MGIIKKFTALAGSMKTALVLFILIIIISITAVMTNSRGVFRSPLFLVPTGCFFLNLAVCSISRFVKRKKTGAHRRFGPDIIHLAVMLLILSGVLSLFLRSQAGIILREGEGFRLPGNLVIRAEKLSAESYENGRPKDWLTDVAVEKDGKLLRKAVIEVNKPLSAGGYKIYQNSFYHTADILLSAGDGGEERFSPGEGFRYGGRTFRIESADTGKAGEKSVTFLTGQDRRFTLRAGETGEGITVKSVTGTDKTGLLVTRNPLFPFIIIFLFIFLAGLTLTFYQKIGDNNK